MDGKRVALITGAASGIGLAVSRALKGEGMQIVMADVDGPSLLKRAAELNACPVVADLSLRKDCRRLAETALERFGRVDVLINVAGIQTIAPIEHFPEEKWELMISLMLTAPFLLTKYVWESMRRNGWGRIIHLNSIHGLVASEYKAAYVAAKHGLMGLTKAAGLEGGPLGITVNSVCPSYVKTPLLENQIKGQAEAHQISEEQVVQDIMLQKAAVKELIEPETIAEVVKFLCSESAAHITGAAIPVDGGWTAS